MALCLPCQGDRAIADLLHQEFEALTVIGNHIMKPIIRQNCIVRSCAARTGEGVAPEVIEQVKQTMVACSQQCLNAMRKEGIKVLALLSQDVDAIDKIQCSVQTARWRRILEVRPSPLLRRPQPQASLAAEACMWHPGSR